MCLASRTRRMSSPSGEGVMSHPDALERQRLIRKLEESNRQLRASEARLRQIIDLAPLYIYAKDYDGRFILANRLTAQAFGRLSADVEGKTYSELIPWIPESDQYLSVDRDVIDSGAMKVMEET